MLFRSEEAAIQREAAGMISSLGYAIPVDHDRKKEIEREVAARVGVSRKAVQKHLWAEVGRLIRETCRG